MNNVSCLRNIKAILSDTASRLTGDFEMPISVRAVCQTLDIRVRRHPNIRAAVLVNVGDAPEVLLPARAQSARSTVREGHIIPSPNRYDQSSQESWERYVVAHELGHYVLFRERLGKPLGSSEYWIQEELCDSFARWLLLPQKAIENLYRTRELVVGRSSPERASEVALELAREIKRIGRVPWHIAANRISDRLEGIGFMTIRAHNNDRLRVVVSTLPRRKEIGRFVSKSSGFGQVLDQQRKAQVAPIGCSLFDAFPSLSKIKAATAERVSNKEWHVAALLE
jgi:hypothetical protein